MRASGGALGRLARQAATEGRIPHIVALAGGDVADIRGEHVTEMVQRGDPAALGLLDEVAWWVAIGINNLMNVFDAEIVVIGGGLSEVGEPLLEAIRRSYERIMVDRKHRPMLPIVQAHFGENASAIGAAEIAAEALAEREHVA